MTTTEHGTNPPTPPEGPGRETSPTPARRRSLAARAGDLGLAVAIVLGFFALCTTVLWLLFPIGVELGGADRTAEVVPRPARPIAQIAQAESAGGIWSASVGLLAFVRRSAMSKPADSIAWNAAEPGQVLADRDAIQTLSASSATVDLKAGSGFTIGEHSMVIVRSVRQEAATGARRASVVLLGGELSGRLAPERGVGRSEVEVALGPGMARIAGTRGSPAAFRVVAGANGAPSVLSVQEGRAEIEAGGRTVVVGPNRAVTLAEDGTISAPFALPAAPTLAEPSPGARRLSRTLPVDVAFAWHGEAEGYRVVLARDREFREILLDERTDRPELRHGNLESGRYHWRVAATRRGVDGPFAEPRSFEIAHDALPPSLAVEFPQGKVPAGELALRGSVEPGARVFVAKEPVGVAESGAFAAPVRLRAGPNLIVVEAMDSAGNVAYRSAVVNAGPARIEDTP